MEWVLQNMGNPGFDDPLPQVSRGQLGNGPVDRFVECLIARAIRF